MVCIRNAREDPRPELTSVPREVARMKCTINSSRITVVHFCWIWKVWKRVLVVVSGVQRKGSRRHNSGSNSGCNGRRDGGRNGRLRHNSSQMLFGACIALYGQG